MTRIACVQVASRPGEGRADRVRRVLEQVSEVASADLIVLPELWATGYFSFDHYAADAEGLDGPTVHAISAVAKRLGTYLVGGSMVESHPGGLANTCLVFLPDGRLIHTYRKIHLFGHHSEEATLLTAGEEVEPVTTELGLLAVTTCYDLRFPELYRLLVERGAEILVVPAAWPAERLEHWRLLVQARAVENLAWVVACNGAGVQSGVKLGGHSMVVDPWGRIIAEAGTDEEVLTATVDLREVARTRSAFPVLTHRRIATGPGVAQVTG